MAIKRCENEDEQEAKSYDISAIINENIATDMQIQEDIIEKTDE